MISNYYDIANSLISQLTQANQHIIKKHSEQMKNISSITFQPTINVSEFFEKISIIDSVKEEYIERIIIINESILNAFIEQENVILEENKKNGKLFNPLIFFNIGETMHSFLLAFLLNPYSDHGQDKLFLKEFLKILKISVNDNDHWIVTAETGRIDILLKRVEPKTIVVIENKSNFAVDQQNQLYRYWFQEIYFPNRYRSDVLKYASSNKIFQIIYLSPADWKIPSKNTFQRPVGMDKSLPDILPIEPKVILFDDNIVNWLKSCLSQIHESNNRLREFLKQYIELWT